MVRIADRLQTIQPPPISEVKSWLAENESSPEKPLLDLCQAIPSYPPPAELTAHLQAALTDPQCYKYSPDEGLPEVRQAVCDWYQRRYGAGPHSNQLCLTIGASQAFWLAMCSIAQPGDEVIVQLPAYFDHPMGLQALGLKPVFAPCLEQLGGLLDTETIAGLIGPRTRAILLVTPSNPTGAVISPAQLEELLLLAQRHDIALVLDETYNAFIAGAPHQLFARTDWPDQLIQIASFGKTFALTGLRCGALVASEELIAQALKLQDSMAVCQPRPAQLALAYGCNHLDQWVERNRQMMQQRHDRFRAAFLAADLPLQLVASGSFFAWVKHPWPELTGRQAAKRLLEQANLICLPGEAFGPGLEGYLRLALGNLPDEAIEPAIERLRLA